MELTTLLLLAAAAFAVAALMVATGFGLGTALTPLFLLAFDVKTAVFLVAIVHFSNGVFRLALFRAHIERRLVVRFGLLSVIGALTGALLQERLASTALEAGLGALLVALGLLALVPSNKRWTFPPKLDPLGGLLSGLLGGLVGNQGALRSAYLLNYALGKDAFIATGTAIACLVDLSRLPVYFANYGAELAGRWPYLLPIIAAAWVGAVVGKRLVTRLATRWFRAVVAAVIAATGAWLILRNL